MFVGFDRKVILNFTNLENCKTTNFFFFEIQKQDEVKKGFEK